MSNELLNIFDSLPGCYLVLAPEAPAFTILGVNKAYAAVTRTGEEIIGRPLFDVFPDNPGNPVADGVKNLTASLMTVLQTGRKHVMPIQRYDTRQPGSDVYDIRYWKPVNIPVLRADGTLQCIIHSVEDVTEAVLLRRDLYEKECISQQQLTDAVRTTQELERMEISQELHDNVNQLLNMARLYLELGLRTGTGAEPHIQEGHALVQKAIEEVRKISEALVHSSEEEQNLEAALEVLLDQVMEVKKINVVKQIELPDEALIESKVKTALFRIVQEQVANVVKHSEAKNLFIELSFRERELELTIRDDGRGFDMGQHSKGMGFRSMKSRAAIMDGRVLITSAPGDGCQVRVVLPASRS
ncbi:MAG TPA: ATP-binding protein [Chitinophagaceae bacterium]